MITRQDLAWHCIVSGKLVQMCNHDFVIGIILHKVSYYIHTQTHVTTSIYIMTFRHAAMMPSKWVIEGKIIQ